MRLEILQTSEKACKDERAAFYATTSRYDLDFGGLDAKMELDSAFCFPLRATYRA